MRFRSLQISLAMALLLAAVALAETPTNWPSWRGPADTGSTTEGIYPVEWTPGSVLWKAPLPGKGCSTPIVWEDRIYLTAPTDGRDSLLALDGSGKPLWTTSFGAETPGKHRNGSGSNPSPVTDGEAVFVSFKSGTLAAVEFDGTIRWQTNLVERFGPHGLFWDFGTSPVLTEKHVVVARMHDGDSWLAAFDKATGEIEWKVARNYKTPTEGDHGYTSPMVIRHDGKEAILLWGAEHLTLHDTKSGSVIWTCGGFNPERKKLWPAIAMPVIVDDMVVVAYGRNDRGIPTLHGIRLEGAGDVTGTHRVWKRDDVGTFVPSPVAWKDRAYIVGDQGKVHCLDPASGTTIWSDAFPRHRNKFYSSPTIAGGKLYAAREDGIIFVASVVDGFKLLAENDMGEPIIASPVPTGNRLLIRGQNHLFCIAGS